MAMAADPTNENRYFGLLDLDTRQYRGLILQEFKNGGLTLYYMTKNGWVEDNHLIEDLHDTDVRPITADQAASIAKARFDRIIT